MSFITFPYFFFCSVVIPLIDFFIGVAQSDSISGNYSNFSQSFIDELNEGLNSVKNKKNKLMAFSGVATICSIICGILSSILFTQFKDVQIGHVNYSTYDNQNIPQQGLLPNNYNNNVQPIVQENMYQTNQ